MQRKTKEMKEMQGTYEPSKEGFEPLQIDEMDKIPTAPDGWAPSAQKTWRDQCRELQRKGYLSRSFLPGFKSYCFAIYQAEVAMKMILSGGEFNGFVETQTGTEGQEYSKLSTWLQVLDNANKWIEKLGAKFGATPADAMKIPKAVKEPGKTMSLLK